MRFGGLTTAHDYISRVDSFCLSTSGVPSRTQPHASITIIVPDAHCLHWLRLEHSALYRYVCNDSGLRVPQHSSASTLECLTPSMLRQRAHRSPSNDVVLRAQMNSFFFGLCSAIKTYPQALHALMIPCNAPCNGRSSRSQPQDFLRAADSPDTGDMSGWLSETQFTMSRFQNTMTAGSVDK